jgi:demethylmenaquinone methyltransferase/2-methoxy-6-polyprenyl-1,4-benzoquinol methylase
VTKWTASPGVKATRDEIVATYDGYAPFYADVTVWEEETRDTVVARADIREGQRVLDCGCGPGTVVLEAAERVGPSGEVCGVDLSPKMLAEATQRAERAGLEDRISLQRADLYAGLPFESDSFDVVISTYVFDLIDTPELPKLMAELVRVLKPGGRLVLGSWTFGEGSHRSSSDLYVEVYERIKVAFACRPLHLQPCLEELGLANLEREYIPHALPPDQARLLFGPLAQELKAHPDLEQRVAALESFVFSSEVLSGTKP